MWRLIFLVALFSKTSVQAYKVAVLEYYPSTESTPDETIKKNLEKYQTFADQAKGVNIIIFPEYGLTTRVTTNIQNYATEITDNNHIITKLSTIASEREIYVVVNLLEKEILQNKIKFYNTNLVFHKNGSIILKYRKINLYNESEVTPGSTTQQLTFKTNFGGTFGIFTSSDILFRNPSRTILKNLEVASIIFPTAWESKIPFATTLTVQHGYALANGVNLFAASYAKPTEGFGGSGIYLSNGKIAETYIGDSASSKLIIQDVVSERENTTICRKVSPYAFPGDVDRLNVTDYNTQKIFSAEKYQFQALNLSQKQTVTKLCDRDFCCNFDIVVDANSRNSSDIYKMMIFDGYIKSQQNDTHVRICSLVACENENKDSCGARVNVTTKFTKITVKGNLPYDETAFYTPVTLNYFLLPIPLTTYCNNKNDTNSTYVELTSLKGPQSVLVYGLFGRTDAPIEPEKKDDDNDNDNNDDDNSAAIAIQAGFLCLTLILLTSCTTL